MKMRWEVDCSAEEARQVLGLPDVKPAQAAVMAKIEQRLLDTIDSFGPETILKSWFSLIPQGAEEMRNLFAGFLRIAATKKSDDD
jgi:N-methylhydantoinase B/oxoprolinase/acetone carboxylase alpha subunit